MEVGVVWGWRGALVRFVEPVFFYLYVDLSDQTQVLSLYSKCLYPLNRVSSPASEFLIKAHFNCYNRWHERFPEIPTGTW